MPDYYEKINNFGTNIQNNVFEAAGPINAGSHWVNIIGISSEKIRMFGGGKIIHPFLKIWNPIGGKVSWINASGVSNITVYRF